MVIKVVDFPSAYHGIIEVRKIKKKYLKKLIEAELSKRSDIPKPFAFSYKICEETDNIYKVSVCVVSKEKLEEVLRSFPEVTYIFTEEVAFSSYLMEKFQAPAWGAIVKEKEMLLFLFNEGCVVYSTRVPIVSGFDDVFVEAVNSVLRYAVGVLGFLPDKLFISGSIPSEVLNNLILDCELVDWEGEVVLNLVEDYNLLPDEIKEERKTLKLYKSFALFMILVNLILLGYCGFLLKDFIDVKKQIEKNNAKLEELSLKYERLKRLREIYKERKKILEIVAEGKKSLSVVNHLYSVFSYLVGEGIKVKEMEAKEKFIFVKGSIEAKSKAMGYLRYLDMVGALTSKFKIIERSFSPESGAFSISLELIQ